MPGVRLPRRIGWSQVGGQSHLDLMPWYLKLALGLGGAFTAVKATAAAVAGERAWNAHSLRWLGLMLALLLACGLASYYAHMSEESDQDQQQESALTSQAHWGAQRFTEPVSASRVPWAWPRSCGSVR